ncbi:4'-phosphopantetheinyl transferase family protein [Streptomyces vietnamensis]|uniref:4'-phosphopantetheinyl transferase family protein n=1 Tax=Streptomyces vietnamensis TaxID=362257 RepID=UPI0037AE3B15
MRTKPGRVSAEIWWAAVRPTDEAAIALLSAAERERSARFHRIPDRDRFVSSRVLLRAVVAGRLGLTTTEVSLRQSCSTCGGGHGPVKVVDASPPLEVSLSHTGDRVVVAVSGSPVGVDIERIRPLEDVERMMAVALSPEERRSVAALPPSERSAAVLAAWTRKEAVLKAWGCGLTSISPTRLTVSSQGREHLLTARPPEAPATPVRLRTLTGGLSAGYAGALAVAASEGHDVPLVVTERNADALLRGATAQAGVTSARPYEEGL